MTPVPSFEPAPYPKARNAWCNEFTGGLQERLPELEDDRDIRCVILTGDENGRALSAGQT